MSWSRFSSLLAHGSRSQSQPAASAGVDAELRRWRTAGVPVEAPRSAEELRAKTLVTIGAAMRQAQLERQRSHQQRRWRYALSAAAVLVGLGGAVYTGAEYTTADVSSALQTQAVLTGQSGRVWVGAASSGELVRRAPLGEGATHALSVGDRVITQLGGEADLAVGDTQVQLHQHSELLLARNDRLEKRLALNEGVIDVRVEHEQSAERATKRGVEQDGPKRRVVVDTPDATVVVHGTVFSVGVVRESGQSTTTVSVRRGVVAVLKNGVELQRLRAGQSWSSRPAEAARAPVPGEPARASSPGSELRPATSAIAGGPRTNKQRPSAPLASRVKVPEDALAVDTASSTLEEENRLFRFAIDARNDGDDSGAVRYFDQLLATYPKSALGQEAKVERFRALKRMGRGRDAAREARRYLIEHGNGFAEDEARDVALTPGP